MRTRALTTLLIAATGCMAPSGVRAADSSGASGATAFDPVRHQEYIRELLELELAGWRLPDPSRRCLRSLKFKHVKVAPYGNSESDGSTVVVVSGKGPHYRVLSVRPDPKDASVRWVEFEILEPTRKGRSPLRDVFSYVENQVDLEILGRATMLSPPKALYVRKACR